MLLVLDHAVRSQIVAYSLGPGNNYLRKSLCEQCNCLLMGCGFGKWLSQGKTLILISISENIPGSGMNFSLFRYIEDKAMWNLL